MTGAAFRYGWGLWDAFFELTNVKWYIKAYFVSIFIFILYNECFILVT